MHFGIFCLIINSNLKMILSFTLSCILIVAEFSNARRHHHHHRAYIHYLAANSTNVLIKVKHKSSSTINFVGEQTTFEQKLWVRSLWKFSGYERVTKMRREPSLNETFSVLNICDIINYCSFKLVFKRAFSYTFN